MRKIASNIIIIFVLCFFAVGLIYPLHVHAAESSVEQYYKFGMQLQQNNKIPEAIGAFKKALEIKANHEPTLLALSLLYLRVNDLNSAESYVNKVLEKNPNHPVALNNLALVLLQREDIKTAITIFEKALRADPDNVQIRKNLAFVFVKVGDYKLAAKHYEILVSNVPGDVELVTLLAATYYKIGDHPKAIEWLNKTLKLDKNNAEAHYSLGAIYFEKNMNKEALESFEKANRLDPSQLHYKLGLARVLKSLKRYRQAKALCNEILQIKSDNMEANKLLIDIQNEMKKKQKELLLTIFIFIVITIVAVIIIIVLIKKSTPINSGNVFEEWERNLHEYEESSSLPAFILSSFSEFLKLPEGAIFLINQDHNVLEIAGSNTRYHELVSLEIQRKELDAWIKGKQYAPQTVIQAKRYSLFSRVFPNAVEIFEKANLKLLIPIVAQNNFFGLVLLGGLSKTEFTKILKNIRVSKLETLQKMADRAARAVEISTLHRLSTVDENTGLYNKRHLQHCIKEEIKRASLYGQSCSFLMFDLDHFKQLNDTHGHPQGDEVLRELAAILKLNVREDIDIVARYGGEEFTIVLPGVGVEKGMEIAEHIREQVAQHKFLQPAKAVNMTVSIGVATFPDHAQSEWELLKKADIAMYHSKKTGRNKVTVASKDMTDSDLHDASSLGRNETILPATKDINLEKMLPTLQDFHERMMQELEKAKKEKYELSLSLVEVKNFYELGKTSHVIPQLISILQPLLRIYDLFGLYNERAFLIMLPERSIASATELIDKFATRAKENKYYGIKGVPDLRISIASYPIDGKEIQELLEQVLVKDRYVPKIK